MRVAHLAEQVHILLQLIMIFLVPPAELEVDDNHLPAVGHHAVGAKLTDFSLGCDADDGALVE